MVNGTGRLFRVPLAAPSLTAPSLTASSLIAPSLTASSLIAPSLIAPSLIAIDTGPLTRCNNDHGFSRDGQDILFSSHRDHGAEIFRLPRTGSPELVSAELVSPEPPSWFHGTAPDCSGMTYAAAREGRRTVDIYTKSWDRPEQRLTGGEGHSDGPEYAADGTKIFFNNDRTGRAQIWVMASDGTNQRPLFSDTQVNWFPHPSPDGQHLLYLAYPPGTQGHPRDLHVALCLATPDGTNRRRVVELTGGQGTLNVPSWSPDSAEFAFMRFATP